MESWLSLASDGIPGITGVEEAIVHLIKAA